MTDPIKNPTAEFKKGLGLKSKFSFAIILLISIVIGSVTTVVVTHVRDTMLAQMRVKGTALARGLANNAAEAMAQADRLLLSELVDKAAKQEAGIQTAALVSSKNEVLASSNAQAEGRAYPLPPNAQSEKIEDGTIYAYPVNNQPSLDFTVPIMMNFRPQPKMMPDEEPLAGELELPGAGKPHGKKVIAPAAKPVVPPALTPPKAPVQIGFAHVIYSLSIIEKAVNETLQGIIWIFGGSLVLGILVSLFLVNRITRPVRQLAHAAETVGRGQLDMVLKVTAHDELGQLAHTFNWMAANLKQAQSELIVKERLQREMELARQIQALLVPKQTPQIPGYSIGMLYRSAEEVGGDYFDFIDLGKKNWGMIVADVSGKGVPGAFVMTQVRSVVRSLARETLSPMEVIARTNAQLAVDMRENMFITLTYGVLDAAKRSLTLCRAGHLAAIIYRAATKNCDFEMPIGIAIGISDQEIFDSMLNEKKLKLSKGDFILLYTDGVDEACNTQQELFGRERLIKTIVAAAALPADKIIRELDKAITAFVGAAPQHDDITMMLVKCEEEA